MDKAPNTQPSIMGSTAKSRSFSPNLVGAVLNARFLLLKLERGTAYTGDLLHGFQLEERRAEETQRGPCSSAGCLRVSSGTSAHLGGPACLFPAEVVLPGTMARCSSLCH